MHEQGQYTLHSSYDPRGTITHPAMGAWVVRMKGRQNKTLPGFVSVGGSAANATGGFMGAEFSAVPLGRADEGLKNSERAGTVGENDFHARLAIADKLNQKFHERFKIPQVKAYESLYEEAVKLMKSEDLKAFDISLEDYENRERYGNNGFGQGCVLAKRLVSAGVRFVEVTLGGWDTHYDNFTAVEARANVLDQGYTALLKDLEANGLLDKTLVVIGTEFGRSPEIVTHHNNGRDHHPACFSCVLAGGGVQGGRTYGKSDPKGIRPKEDPVTMQDLNSTIGYALGIDSSKILHSPSGRPFRMGGADAQLGSPITSIFA